MTTITTTKRKGRKVLSKQVKEVFSFSELNDEAKAHACEKYRDSNPYDYEWYDSEFEYWVDKLDTIGFEDAKIHFSGFYSQGDGACFDADCNVVKLATHLKYMETFRAWELTDILADSPDKFDTQEDINLSIHGTDHHYSHENCRHLELTQWNSDTVDDSRQVDLEDFEKECEQLRYDLSREIYKALEDCWDGMQTDEYCGESMENNSYEFDKEGNKL